jgi:hypothetical protein
LSACAGGQEAVQCPEPQPSPAASNDGKKAARYDATVPDDTAAPDEAAAPEEMEETSSPSKLTSEPFPEGDAVCKAHGFSCPEKQVCALGYHMEPICIPVLTSKDVEVPANFSKVVIIENPQIVTFPRARRCKSVSCMSPGAALQLDGGRTAHFRGPRSKDSPFGSDLVCFQRRCPGHDAERLLGVILPYYDTEGAPPRLEIELLRFDPAPR